MTSKFSLYSAPSSSSEPMVKIGYATDVEGNYDYWSRYIELSEILNRSETGHLVLSADCHFVFGGDVVDRGPGDLRVLSDLINLRRAYPDRVHFIMGNRDINKMRIPVELHPSVMKIPPKVFWVRESESCAADSALLETPAEKLKWVSQVQCSLVLCSVSCTLSSCVYCVSSLRNDLQYLISIPTDPSMRIFFLRV